MLLLGFISIKDLYSREICQNLKNPGSLTSTQYLAYGLHLGYKIITFKEMCRKPTGGFETCWPSK